MNVDGGLVICIREFPGRETLDALARRVVDDEASLLPTKIGIPKYESDVGA